MSEVQNRTMLMDRHDKNGESFHKMRYWARVTTEVGSGYEPFFPGGVFVQGPHGNYDPEDSMSRIDGIEYQDPNILYGDRTCGGDLVPRVGR